MEIIVLGLLMLKKCSIYEMKKDIATNFTAMSSDSTGSIQTTIKKLMKNGLITFNELVENSVNKKIYELTDSGRAYFLNTISKPMQYKEKNMELAKFFFMGFTVDEQWKNLLDSYISELKIQKEQLEKIYKQIPENIVASAIGQMQKKETFDSYKQIFNTPSIEKHIQNISIFQIASLEFSIAKFDFEINWFEQFIETLKVRNIL